MLTLAKFLHIFWATILLSQVPVSLLSKKALPKVLTVLTVTNPGTDVRSLLTVFSSSHSNAHFKAVLHLPSPMANVYISTFIRGSKRVAKKQYGVCMSFHVHMISIHHVYDLFHILPPFWQTQIYGMYVCVGYIKRWFNIPIYFRVFTPSCLIEMLQE